MQWLLWIEIPALLVAAYTMIELALTSSARRRNEQLNCALYRLENAAQATVKEVQQTLAHDMKMARVEQRLKGDTAAELRSTAIKILNANLGPLGLYELRRALGLKRKAPLDRLLVGRIEAALFDIKRGATTKGEVIPSVSGKRFYPETMRIPKVDKTVEEHPELFDEKTQLNRR